MIQPDPHQTDIPIVPHNLQPTTTTTAPPMQDGAEAKKLQQSVTPTSADKLPSLQPPSSQHHAITDSQEYAMPGNICDSIKKQHKGKAAGLTMDSLDTFISLAKLNNTDLNKDLQTIFNLVFIAKIPPDIVPYFTDTYLFCLHKSLEDDKLLRPIGIPSALRRIICNHISREYRQLFAQDLAPINFCVGIESGMDFIIKAIQLGVEKYIINPQAQGRLPTRVLIALDLTNMFNKVSREKLLQIIKARYPDLLPLATLLYGSANNVHFKWVDGTWHLLPMEEGVNQGCPLSSTFASLVLNEVLRPLDAELKHRANMRYLEGHLGDDGYGGVSHLMAYIDDKSALVPHEDAQFCLQKFVELASPLGCKLNPSKTRILTSCNGTSILPSLSTINPALAQQLADTIAAYSTTTITNNQGISQTTPLEVTTGLRILGAPVGSMDFARSFFLQNIESVKADAHCLNDKVTNLQTRLRIFSQCTIQRLPHLLGNDVLHFLNTDEFEGDDWDDWNGPLTQEINTITL